MTELTEITGVGPSYAETLEDNGYETAEDVAGADPEELDELIERADGSDLVVNAMDAVPLDDIDDDPVADDADGGVDEDESTDDDDSGETIVTMDPHLTETQEVHLIRALVREEVRNIRRNDTDGSDMTRDVIRQVRDGRPYELTLQQCDYAYRATNQLQQEYQQDRHINSLVGEVRELTEMFQQARTGNW